MDNICAQVSLSGELEFSLIDFGVSSKIPSGQKPRKQKSFRGNFVFSSFDHLIYGRANQLDDITSLVYVAQRFLFGQLPWELDPQVREDQSLVNRKEFSQLRLRKIEQFKDDLVSQHSPFKGLLKYLED